MNQYYHNIQEFILARRHTVRYQMMKRLRTYEHKYAYGLQMIIKAKMEELAKEVEHQLVHAEMDYVSAIHQHLPRLEQEKHANRVHRYKSMLYSWQRNMENIKLQSLANWLTLDDVKEIAEIGFEAFINKPENIMKAYEHKHYAL